MTTDYGTVCRILVGPLPLRGWVPGWRAPGRGSATKEESAGVASRDAVQAFPAAYVPGPWSRATDWGNVHG